ncbi:MAG TPA: T9SS type A sorting domain-containing protein [Bacteroidales bacterium]|nr:T9SS type A sorting domain-containing protein [Bacteroidales bacterium]
MKKLFFLGVCLSLLFSGMVQAQNTCSAPAEILTLPYSATGLNTAGTIDNYGPDDACGSDAMECEDYVFEFTPASDMSVRIALSNTVITSEIPFGVTANIGLFVTEGCPDQFGSVCVASIDTETENPELPQVSLTGGTTYYIIVSSTVYEFFMQQFQTTVSFDIVIEQLFDTDAQVLSINPIASGCGLTQAEITATFKNAGTSDISNFEVSYQIIGSSPVVETYTGTLEPGEDDVFTFSVPADISAIGTHNIKVYVSLLNDENETNDFASISVTNTPVINVLPSLADFEADNGYFYTEGTNSSWQHGMPDAGNPELVINVAYSGDNIWATNLAGNANTGEVSYLISPCYDLSSLYTPTVRFQLWAEPGLLPGVGGTATLEASINGGSSYTITVATWNASTGGWAQQEFELADLQGETNVRFRFTYTSGFMASEGIAIDDFMVKDEILNDMGPGVLALPVGACGLTDQEYVKLYMINHGAIEQSNIPVTYSLDGGETWLPVTETIPGPVPPHDSVPFTFDARADMIIPGSYMLVVKTMLTGDETPENDSRTFEIINTMVVDEIPYTQSFETEDHGWVGSAGSSWARGIPSDTLTINHAYDGQYIMATNPTGNTNINEISELVSPCFDVSGNNAVRLSMKVWYETGFMPATIDLEGSNDGGQTWFSIEQGWTGSSAGWITKSYYVTEFSGQTSCKVRIKYNGQLLPSEGIAIDYVKIEPVFAKDLGVSAYIGPANGCSMGNNEQFVVEVSNYGSNPQSSFQVQYSLNGGANWTSQAFSGILGAQQVSTVTFTQGANLSAIDEYDVIFRTLITGDENPDNDALQVTVIHSGSISEFPYAETFETGDGGWFTYGTNSSFELGTPAGTIINTAGEGNYSWVTNLDGNHNNSELSYLQGPCFDFSSMVNPMIKARINYETSMFMAGFYVEYSINSGASWDTVSSGGATGLWYGSSLLPGFGSTWSGSSSGWINVATNMPELAGQSNVYLRFTFNSGSFSFMPTEGVGIDNINIYDCTELPQASFEYTADGLDVQFTSEIADADSISWNFGDNEFLPTTSTEANPAFTYLAEGTYLVTLSVFNSCGSTTVQQYIDVFTGISHNPTRTLRMYPNPAESVLFIETGSSTGRLNICSLQGQVLLSYDLQGETTQISLEGMSAGMYLVSIETNAEKVVKPLIIK